MKLMKKLCTSAYIATSFTALMSMSQVYAAGGLTYDKFLDSCKNPSSYGAQSPPQNIHLSCQNVQTTWNPIEAGGTALDESRVLSTELFSDKYHVVLQDFAVETPEFNVSCPRFREVVETSQIDKAMTCDQVLAETRDFKEICLDAINEAISENPDLVTVVATGRTFSSCSGTTQKP